MKKKINNLDNPGLFWSTQPVPKLEDYHPKSEKPEDLALRSITAGPIDEKKTVEMVRKDPYPLPEPYEWVDVNLADDFEAKKVYDLLTENYVEDDDNMFRFDYSIEFLRWAVMPPNYYKEWLAGVQVKKTKKLVAFITAIPLHLLVKLNFEFLNNYFQKG